MNSPIVNPFFLTSTSNTQGVSGYSSHPSHLSIRSATSADVLPLTEVLAESFHSREGFFGWVYPILRLGIYEDLRNRLASGTDHYVCLVALNTNSARPQVHKSPLTPEVLMGTVEMALRSPNAWIASGARQFPYLSNLAVHPQYRRLGVAQQLLSRCEAIARQWGYSQLYLHVLENNSPAKRLYFKAGYRLAEIDHSWNPLLFGQPRRLFMGKTLNR
ncbi:GNAT family N-acetyltransferase [Limnoraphis robusta]|uniref:GCN5 family acetyltransferase n=1 Tax=Limnoraphis robusta CS-951 TaxID=1637645 RepID=A0A0F5YA70_9CYAN|nr:GNAT family N-acetyltransferase [Limnoraphis robusta]KKD35070.1 GCN5 family acetyltransferase [Limnoraphis robusta CS-951]